LGFLLRPEVLDKLQQDLNMTDQEFAETINISRSSLWRAKLPAEDNRFSLGQDVIVKVLNRFPNLTFDEVFFLDKVSHECDNKELIT
jgi:predicted transcriptional regulator